MKFRTLEEKDLPALVSTFNQAFDNYFVHLQFDEESFRKRFMERDKVSLEHSGAYFDESGKMTAFILHSGRGNLLYNAGTGVLPEYRGKGLTERLYQEMISSLDLKPYDGIALEVITKNEGAIKVYERLGFKKSGIINYPELKLDQFQMELIF